MIFTAFDKMIGGLTSVRDKLIVMKVRQRCRKNGGTTAPDKQYLEVYWKEGFAEEVETWGQNSVWIEIQCFLANAHGRVLDIACGTGAVIKILNRFKNLEVHGCDISDLLIRKANESGIPSERLKVTDATHCDYPNDFFDYAYSIGSLEHFTEEGIQAFLKECYRYTRKVSFHQIPTSRSGRDEGWLRLDQSYFNNSVDWWLQKMTQVYPTVHVIDSGWKDPISLGKWFVCVKS